MSIHEQVFVRTCFHFSCGCIEEWNCWVMHCFTSPCSIYEGFSFSPFVQKLVVCLFNDSHPTGCKVVCDYGFDLHFPRVVMLNFFFHVLFHHLFILFREMSIQILHPSLIGLFISLLLSTKSSLYIQKYIDDSQIFALILWIGFHN